MKSSSFITRGVNVITMNLHARTGRGCSRVGCRAMAAMTLTYIYADSTAVVGPLGSVGPGGRGPGGKIWSGIVLANQGYLVLFGCSY